MGKVTSKDGTNIAFDTLGKGPAVILIAGAFGYRAFGPMVGLALLLANNFTVVLYDRRGRGDSGDTQPFDKKREIEDIDALIDSLGASAYLYGISSGAFPGTLLPLLKVCFGPEHAQQPPSPDFQFPVIEQQWPRRQKVKRCSVQGLLFQTEAVVQAVGQTYP